MSAETRSLKDTGEQASSGQPSTPRQVFIRCISGARCWAGLMAMGKRDYMVILQQPKIQTLLSHIHLTSRIQFQLTPKSLYFLPSPLGLRSVFSSVMREWPGTSTKKYLYSKSEVPARLKSSMLTEPRLRGPWT